jgi:hypothetical protein
MRASNESLSVPILVVVYDQQAICATLILRIPKLITMANVHFAPHVDADAAAAAAAAFDAAADAPPADAGADADAAAVPPAAGGGAGGASLENLKTATGLLPFHFGDSLWATHSGATDQQVVAPLLAMGERPADADLSNLFRQLVDDPDVKYYLAVIEGRVEVLHQLHACHATAGNGQRVLGLRGDRTMVAGLIVPPKLQSLRGAINNQALAIGLEEVAAPTMDNIAALYAADAALDLVPPLQAAGDEALQTLEAWKLVDIHPKLAPLFLQGMTVREAFFLFRSIEAAIEPTCRPGLRVLEDFIRCAVTSTAVADPDSAMATAWSRFDHSQSNQLETWYCKIVAKLPTIAPPAAAAPLPLPPLPPQVPGNPNLLLTALTSLVQSQNNNNNNNPAGKAYLGHELPKLLSFCGYNPPYDVLTEDHLSEFLLQAKPFRRNLVDYRGFYATFRGSHLPANSTEYSWVPSSAFLKGLKALEFDGNDQLLQYDLRHLGIGPFSMAPSSAWGEDDSGTRLAQIAVFEETESMHGPADRASMSSLSTSCAPIPMDVMGMFRVVDHLKNQLIILFTKHCSLVPYLQELVNLLREGKAFGNSRPQDFTCFMWYLHVACREYFGNKRNTDIIERMVVDLRGKLILSISLPPALQPVPDAPRFAFSPSNANKRQKSTSSASFVSRFRQDLDRAVAKTMPQPFMAHDLCADFQQVKELFGPDFLALMPNGSEPCIDYFIFGNCYNGQFCQACHSLSAEPSKRILDGLEMRVTAHIDAFLPQV